MQIADLAQALRQLFREHSVHLGMMVSTMSDDDVIKYCVFCPCCGHKYSTAEELIKAVKKGAIKAKTQT